MTTYTILADVNEQRFQNPQELGVIWGEITDDIESFGGELLDSYLLIGNYDFQITFEADDEDAVAQIAMAIQRHGLDTRTMRAIPVGRLGELVNDFE
ncbi:GYD domain-containing protein [Haladaptatus sp. NG-SE-30]